MRTLYINTMALAIYSIVLGLVLILTMSLGYFSTYMVMSDDVVTLCSILGCALCLSGFVMMAITVFGVSENGI